jgi:hypothetical protein
MAGRYLVTGRVHPERASIGFGRVNLTLDGGGTVVASCDASQITLLLDLPKVDGWISALLAAEDVATVIVGALGFSLGSGYWTELVQMTEADGTPHVIGVRPANPDTGETLVIEPQIPIFNRAFRLAGRNVFFRLAIRDYLRAITDPTDCASYCYRAVESIKAAVAFQRGIDRWDEMHKRLGTRREDIESTIKQFADPVRHGNWINAKYTDKFIRWRMLALTRDVLVRYLDHEQPAI